MQTEIREGDTYKVRVGQKVYENALAPVTQRSEKHLDKHAEFFYAPRFLRNAFHVCENRGTTIRTTWLAAIAGARTKGEDVKTRRGRSPNLAFMRLWGGCACDLCRYDYRGRATFSAHRYPLPEYVEKVG